MLASERHANHVEGTHYERHRPEESVLYRVVSAYWSSFRERMEGLGSLPKFVVNEVDEYLRQIHDRYHFPQFATTLVRAR